jgi:hypothetical protein
MDPITGFTTSHSSCHGQPVTVQSVTVQSVMVQSVMVQSVMVQPVIRAPSESPSLEGRS